jgi:hypothetical protein
MRVPLKVIPYLSRVKRLYFGSGCLKSIAHRNDILYPKVTETIRPAVFLAGQIERITGTLPYFNLERVIKDATTPTVTHGPTVAFYVKNAVLLDGAVYAGHYKHTIADKSLFDTVAREACHLQIAALASSYMGTKYFGHWLRDDCVQYELAQSMAPVLCVRRPAFNHQQAYQSYFNQNWTPTDRALIDELIIFQDFAQNRLKRSRYKALRDRIRTQFHSNNERQYIYLRRGHTGSPRTVENENEILEALVAQDFAVVDVETDELSHIINTLLNAKLVISVEGSHIAHCAFTCPDDCGFLVLQPPDRFSMTHRNWAGPLGMPFGFVVGTLGDRGYRFCPKEIVHTVDMMLSNA